MKDPVEGVIVSALHTQAPSLTRTQQQEITSQVRNGLGDLLAGLANARISRCVKLRHRGAVAPSQYAPGRACSRCGPEVQATLNAASLISEKTLDDA